MDTDTRNNIIGVGVGVVGLALFWLLWVGTDESRPSRKDRKLDEYIARRRAELAQKWGVPVSSLHARPRR